MINLFCEIKGERLGHYLSALPPENIIFFYKEEDDDIRGLRNDITQIYRGRPRAPAYGGRGTPTHPPSPPRHPWGLSLIAPSVLLHRHKNTTPRPPTLVRRPRLGLGPPFPRLRVRGWRLSFPPPHSPWCF